MTTSVHLPDDLLQEIDRRASDLGINRDRFIAEAVTYVLWAETEWSEAFTKAVLAAQRDRESQQAVSEMMEAIRSGRTNKGAPLL